MSAEKKITEQGYWECQNPDIYKFDIALAQELARKLKGKTVLDLGCGNGAYTKYLNEHGVTCYGCDGNPYTPDIAPGCGVCDLTKPVKQEKADWVLCLEVAEHIPKEYENALIKNINKLNTEGVILSWAVPGQGGHGHVNEQTNEYVRERMKGYRVNHEWEDELRKKAKYDWFKNIMVYDK